MFQETKETMLKEIKDEMVTMSHQVENIRDINYKKEENGNLRLKA